MARNKSPGSDGLTVEFYCTFFSSLKDILLKLFEEIEKYSKLSRSMRCGIISLIFKKKGDKRFLKNYRPISLLQVDYKILAKVMANRFKQVLCKIVSKCQSCCIPGRDIADTIANIRDVLDLIESEELEGYLLKMDQEKAFDKVGHTYLREVLKKYGFGDRFVNWILGVYVGKNKLFCDDLNWKDKISKIKMLVNLWKQRRLTLSGRATVISSLLMSRLWYTIAVCSIPDWALQSIKKICLDFLWNNGSHLIIDQI
ncbi:Hypothetical predicted protein [Mytilus galloprovincialis]|uniref:Reverse transcriptase domain-containing protein n=1 Tax=Mytilus galloprovincialis TaxID=29158 RepID=A0A8B6GBE3_MYTGA|nr:Hypothetical predicted protein [Mytilus galloprovincialis]